MAALFVGLFFEVKKYLLFVHPLGHIEQQRHLAVLFNQWSHLSGKVKDHWTADAVFGKDKVAFGPELFELGKVDAQLYLGNRVRAAVIHPALFDAQGHHRRKEFCHPVSDRPSQRISVSLRTQDGIAKPSCSDDDAGRIVLLRLRFDTLHLLFVKKQLFCAFLSDEFYAEPLQLLFQRAKNCPCVVGRREDTVAVRRVAFDTYLLKKSLHFFMVKGH